MVKSVSFSPYGGDTIKALEARQKMLSQSAPELPAAKDMRSPWQGASYVANTLVNTIQQNAAINQEREARKQLASMLAGHQEGTGWSNEEFANMGQIDQEFMTHLMDLQAAKELSAGKQENWVQIETPAGETGQWYRDTVTGQEKKVGGSTEGTGPKISDITSFRSQIMGDERYTMAANTIPIYRSMMASAGQNDRTSDLDMVYGLAKMLDPTGVVRGEDAVMIQSNSPLADQIKGWAESLSADPNARLTPEMRRDIMALSYRRANEVAGAYKSFRQQSIEAAIANGIDPAKLGSLEFGEVTPYEPEPDVPDPDVPDPDVPEAEAVPYPGPQPDNWPADQGYPDAGTWARMSHDDQVAALAEIRRITNPPRVVPGVN